MKKDKLQEISRQILELVGGKDNIVRFVHCVTRLRFNVKDKSLVKEEELKKLDGVFGAQWSGEQLQIIIGQAVEEVYLSVCKVAGIEAAEKIDELIEEDIKVKKKFSIKNLFNSIVETITACVEPVFIVFTVGGFLKLITVLLGSTTFGILPDDSDFLVLLTMVTDTCFTFFPIYLAYTSAKRFGANIPLALILACLLLNPTLIEMVNSDKAFTVYGIPMIKASYANSFIPTLLITWALSKVEKLFKNLFPTAIKGILYPLCTMFVMLPLALCILGPMGTIFGQGVANFIVWLQDILGPVAIGLVGALFPLLIVTGMHHALNSIAFVEYMKYGFDTCVMAGSYFMDYQLMSLCFASLIKSRKSENKAIALSCIATEGVGGISEPTIFGIMLKSKRNILYVLLGGFAAGFYVGLMNVKMYVFAPCGFMAVLAYSGGSTANFVHGIIACAIAFIIPFVLALIFGLGIEEDEKVKVIK